MTNFKKIFLGIIISIVMLVNNSVFGQYDENDITVTPLICEGRVEIKLLAYINGFFNNTMFDGTSTMKFSVNGGTAFDVAKLYSGNDITLTGYTKYSEAFNGGVNKYVALFSGDYTEVFAVPSRGDADGIAHTNGTGDYYYWTIYLKGGKVNDWWGKSINLTFNSTWGGSTGSFTKTYILPSYGTNVSALSPTNTCANVQLSWSEQDKQCTGGSGTYFVEVWRNDAYLATVNWDTKSYDDNTAVKGTPYTYKIRSKYVISSPIITNYGTFTQGVQGTRIAYAPAPTEVTGANQCNNTVVLGWKYTSGANPASSYKIKRTDVNNNTTEFTTNTTSYSDATAFISNTYTYSVAAVDQCNAIGAYSAEVVGKSVGSAEAPTNVQVAQVGNNINVTWDNPNTYATSFDIKRRTLTGTFQTIASLTTANTISYLDDKAASCTEYIYQVVTHNDCTTKASAESSPIKVSTDISNSLISVNVTKGEYADKNVVSWILSSSDRAVVNGFKIYRTDGNASITEVPYFSTEDNNLSSYEDNRITGRKVYKYWVKAIATCGNDPKVSNIKTDIGFNMPKGIVTGNITYAGGTAIAGANVRVTGGSFTQSTYSLKGIKSINNQPLSKTDKLGLYNSSFTIEAWIKLSSLTGTLISCPSALAGIDNGKMRMSASLTNYETADAAIGTTFLSTDQWYHVAYVFDKANSKMLMYLNGKLEAQKATTSTIASNADISLSINSFSECYVDELRFWNTVRTQQEIIQNKNKMLGGNETSMTAYYGFDENSTSMFFDYSGKDGVFNRNHNSFTSETSLSTVVPPIDSLSIRGVSNIGGNYEINNVFYNGDGETFTFTPLYAGHTFNPQDRILYIGNAAKVQNNINFTDESAFKVTGFVQYEGTNCYAEGVKFKIDGQTVMVNGLPAVSGADGSYNVSVPIGKHTFTAYKENHTIIAPEFKMDFQTPVVHNFVDVTKRKFIGRVVGGDIESTKILGNSRSKNNIGIATLMLEATNQCYKTTIRTDALTGEFAVDLPPLKFNIINYDTKGKGLFIENNLAIDFGTLSPVDMATDIALQTDRDTTRNSNGIITNIDSVKYHVKKVFTYYSTPQVQVFNKTLTGYYSGEKKYKLGDLKDPLDCSRLPYKVFVQDKIYPARIIIFEHYTNNDNIDQPLFDDVTVKNATITLINNLSYSNEAQRIVLNPESKTPGDTLIYFMAGFPNTLKNSTTPIESFTKTIELSVATSRATVSWSDRAYVFGQLPVGDNFITKGPEIVENILRDPPGSNSYAYIEKGSSTSDVYSFQRSIGGGFNVEAFVRTGFKATVGMGFATTTKVALDVIANSYNLFSDFKFNSYTKTTTFNERIQTSAASTLVGAPSDLFVGHATNFIYGKTESLSILTDSICALEGSICGLDDPNSIYRVGFRSGLFLSPDGFATSFIYTANHIETAVIPGLENLRTGFIGKHKKQTDPWFYKDITDASKAAGVGYTFVNNTGKSLTDTVAWYNQQIDLWKGALRRNEMEKKRAFLDKNRSFNGGTRFESSFTNDITNQVDDGFEAEVELQLGTRLSLEIAGIGGDEVLLATFASSEHEVYSTITDSTFTCGYVLDDPDIGDYFSVDVKRPYANGTGPVFYTKAGQSSCPWEDKEVSKYYEPGTMLSNSTIAREKPSLTVSPSILTNIPSNQAAAFKLNIGNKSDLSEGSNTYALRVIQETNPNGAIIKVNGVPLENAMSFTINSGQSLQAALTVEHGSQGYNDTIKLMLYSECSYTIKGNNGGFLIADTITIITGFIPPCTAATFIDPQDQFVVNNSANNILSVAFNGYNVNDPNLNNIELQYKPATTSNWQFAKRFWKPGTSAAIVDADTLLSLTESYCAYNFRVRAFGLVDGLYNIRMVTKCETNTAQSAILTGTLDRKNPMVFGTPQPVDGSLNPGDDITISFNEYINQNILNPSNFSIEGVLNGSNLNHYTSLYFDGVTNYAKIPQGLILSNKSFTIEMWVRRNNIGTTECLFSQGDASNSDLWFGFNASNNLVFSLGANTATSNTTIADSGWHHVACSWNNLTKAASVYIKGLSKGNGTFSGYSYASEGACYVGSTRSTSNNFYKGNIHELRIWSKAKTEVELNYYINQKISGKEVALYNYWRMDEGQGQFVKDRVRNQNAEIVNATWSVEPKGKSVAFNGTSYLKLESGVAITAENDFSLEFWFKGANANNQTLFSNGLPTLGAPAWSIGTDANGHLKVKNNGTEIDAGTGYFTNNWHHFAMSVFRSGYVNIYIDGQVVAYALSETLSAFDAPFYLGVAYWNNNGTQIYNNYLSGSIDEVKIWNIALDAKRITSAFNVQSTGNETGLLAYYPFETYSSTPQVATGSLIDKALAQINKSAVNNGTSFNTEAPNVKPAQGLETVAFDWVTSSDKVIFNLKETDLRRIENCVLYVTAQGVQDLNFNTMTSPKSWTVFVDQNPLKWQDQNIELKKNLYDTLSFAAVIYNRKGTQETYELGELPTWLTVDQTSGTINPNATKTIHFTIDPGMNPGVYNFDLPVLSSANCNEYLSVSLAVLANEPTWTVNPAAYQYTMGVIGQLIIDGKISRNPYDMVAAFVAGECRGVTHLVYIPAFDKYIVPLTIHSNRMSGETVTYKVWNASLGKIHQDVTPIFDFVADDVQGSQTSPIAINTANLFTQTIPLVTGFNRISINLTNSNVSNVNDFFASIKSASVPKISKKDGYCQYSTLSKNWTGYGLTGIDNTLSYLVECTTPKVLIINGTALALENTPVSYRTGWNWIGYLPQGNMQIKDAMASFNAQNDDILKSADAFAVYNKATGWIGSLTWMKPGQGYVLKTTGANNTFIYPKAVQKTGGDNEVLPTPPVKEWATNPFGYQYSMTITGDIVDNNLISTANENDWIAAFVGDECRGVAKMKLAYSSNYRVFVMVYSNKLVGEKLSFYYYNSLTNQTSLLEDKFDFESNKTVATPDVPYLFKTNNLISGIETKNSEDNVRLYPNPSTGLVSLVLPESFTNGMAKIYDVMGRTVFQSSNLKANINQLNLSALNKGVYMLQIQKEARIRTLKIVIE